jgi:hypothetical protein
VGTGGVLLTLSSALLPWAMVGAMSEAVDPVSGSGHGLDLVLVLTGAAALALLTRKRTLTGLFACAAALSTALVMYQMPGALVDAGAGSIGIAEITWGAYLALAGSTATAVAALRHTSGSDLLGASVIADVRLAARYVRSLWSR